MADLIVGLCAGALCMVSFLPQVVKIIKTRQTKDLSLATFSLFSLGVFLWLVYGVMIKSLPIILTNAIMFVLISVIVFMKIKNS